MRGNILRVIFYVLLFISNLVDRVLFIVSLNGTDYI